MKLKKLQEFITALFFHYFTQKSIPSPQKHSHELVVFDDTFFCHVSKICLGTYAHPNNRV